MCTHSNDESRADSPKFYGYEDIDCREYADIVRLKRNYLGLVKGGKAPTSMCKRNYEVHICCDLDNLYASFVMFGDVVRSELD